MSLFPCKLDHEKNQVKKIQKNLLFRLILARTCRSLSLIITFVYINLNNVELVEMILSDMSILHENFVAAVT